MSTAFPTGLDTTLTLPNPVGTDLLANTNANLDHDYQHSLVNDAIRALETKLGIDSSAVTTSIDYLLKNVASNNPGHTHSSSSLSGVLPLAGGTMSGAIAFAGAQTFDASKLLIASQAAGDILYASSTTAWSRLAKGSDGNVLTLASGVPTWASGGGGGGMSIGGAVTSGTSGSMLYVDSSVFLAQDNSHLFYDATNHALAVGNAAPTAKVHAQALDGALALKGEGQAVNTLYQALILLNNDLPTTGQTGQVVLFDLDLQRSVAGVANPGVAARIFAGKDGGDWVGVDLTAANLVRHGYLAFSTVLAGNTSEKMRISKDGFVGIGQTAPTCLLDILSNSQGSTVSSIQGFQAKNTTAAAAGAQQFSPFIHLEGQGWKTTTTAASQAVAFRLNVEPVQSTTNPLGGLVIRSAINGGSFTNSFVFGSDGALYFNGAVGGTAPKILNSSDSLNLYGGGGGSGLLILHSDNQTQWMDRSGTLQMTFDNSTKRLCIGSGATITAALTVRSSGGTSTGLRFSDTSDNLFANLYSFASGFSSLITDSGIRMKTGAIIGTETNMPTSFAAGILFGVGTAPSADPATTGTGALWCDTNGFQYRVAVTSEGAGILAHLHNRGGDQVGAGTAYPLTTSLAIVTFASGTNPSISLPTAGTYLVMADIEFIAGITPNDTYAYELWNSTDSATIGVSRTDTNIGLSATESVSLCELVTITATKTLTIRAANTTAARGTITSTKTKVRYVRLF